MSGTTYRIRAFCNKILAKISAIVNRPRRHRRPVVSVTTTQPTVGRQPVVGRQEYGY